MHFKFEHFITKDESAGEDIETFIGISGSNIHDYGPIHRYLILWFTKQQGGQWVKTEKPVHNLIA